MSRQFAELCTLLVDEVAGSLASTVFSVLLTHGSLSLPQIIQCSKISPRYVKNALTLLLQRHLITHDSSSQHADRTRYQADIVNAYRLVRAGKYSQLANARLGKDAASIIRKLQQRGFVAATELAKIVDHEQHHSKQGNAEDFPQGTHELLLDNFFKSHHIVRGRPYDLITPSSVRAEAEHELARLRFPRGVTGTKNKQELESAVKLRLKRKRDDNDASLDLITPWCNSQRSGVADTDQHPSPQTYTNTSRKTNGNLGHAEETSANGDSHRNIYNTTAADAGDEEIVPVTATESQRTSKRRKLRSATELDSAKSQTLRSQEITNGAQINGDNAAPTSRRSKRPKLAEAGDSNTTSDALNRVNGERQSAEQGEILKPVQAQSQTARVEAQTESRQVNNEFPNSEGAKDQPFFRVSLDKFDVSMRSQLLVEYSLQCLGEPSCRVYEALLHCAETDIRRCHDNLDNDSDSAMGDDNEDERDEEAVPHYPNTQQGVRVSRIVSTLDSSVDLCVDEAHPKDKSNRSGTASASDADTASSLRMNPRIAQVEHHLRILAEHENAFAYSITTEGQERWFVNFSRLTARMMQRELHNIISTRFDGPSARIVRILQTKGKMEEKYLANMSLVKQKEIRAKLALLQEAGFLDVQEVPRDASRQPSRTIYLWFFDEQRCRNVVLNNTYQMMSRLVQRMRFERTKARSVLDKASRTDVQGREDELLNEREKAALTELERKEEKIWLQVSRLDDTVALLGGLS